MQFLAQCQYDSESCKIRLENTKKRYLEQMDVLFAQR